MQCCVERHCVTLQCCISWTANVLLQHDRLPAADHHKHNDHDDDQHNHDQHNYFHHYYDNHHYNHNCADSVQQQCGV
jgi:hypothetical protein